MGAGMSDAQYFKVAPNLLCIKAAGNCDIASTHPICSRILKSIDLKKSETAKSYGNKIEIPIQLGFSMLFS
jgi:hypothetical protein